MLPSEEELKTIAREVTKHNKALRNFSPNFISKYEDLCYYQLLEYKKTKNLKTNKNCNFNQDENVKYGNNSDQNLEKSYPSLTNSLIYKLKTR